MENNELRNKRLYHQMLRKLEKEKKITNMLYDSKPWLIRSGEVLKRDKHKCKSCGRKTNRVHHRRSALYHPEMSLYPGNLVTMCDKCEGEIHNRN